MTQVAKEDKHYTSPELAEAIVATVLKRYPWLRPSKLHVTRALDPCSGGGAFARALGSAGFGVTSVDQDEDAVGDYCCDFLEISFPHQFSLVCSNPPFSQWQRFVRHSLGMVNDGGVVAFLLRLGALGNSLKQCRAEFLRECPLASVEIIRPRPSFNGRTDTDNSEYIVACWVKGEDAPAILEWMDWDRPKKIRIKKPKKMRKAKANASE